MVEIFESSLTFPSPPVAENLVGTECYLVLQFTRVQVIVSDKVDARNLRALNDLIYDFKSTAFKGLGLYLDFGKEPCVFKKTFQVLRQELR